MTCWQLIAKGSLVRLKCSKQKWHLLKRGEKRSEHDVGSTARTVLLPVNNRSQLVFISCILFASSTCRTCNWHGTIGSMVPKTSWLLQWALGWGPKSKRNHFWLLIYLYCLHLSSLFIFLLSHSIKRANCLYWSRANVQPLVFNLAHSSYLECWPKTKYWLSSRFKPSLD